MKVKDLVFTPDVNVTFRWFNADEYDSEYEKYKYECGDKESWSTWLNKILEKFGDWDVLWIDPGFRTWTICIRL